LKLSDKSSLENKTTLVPNLISKKLMSLGKFNTKDQIILLQIGKKSVHRIYAILLPVKQV